MLAQLKKITSSTRSGLLAPGDPAGKRPPTCYVFMQVKGGKLVRVDSPREQLPLRRVRLTASSR